MKALIGLLVVLLVLLQYRLWFGDGSVQEFYRLRNESRDAQAELIRLRNRNQALEAEVADLKSGLDAIEERARTNLGMIGEDETFFQFVRESESATGDTLGTDRDGSDVTTDRAGD
ncbi:MAG: cell division protein FtsB [Gammaproteobacteria bacterium]|nr:cell division protein FtsB [Gammaproteobacteria bacterium]